MAFSRLMAQLDKRAQQAKTAPARGVRTNGVLRQRPKTVRAWLPTGGAFAMVETWLERSARRHELSGLDADQLRDTGLDATTVAREARKPFWQA